MSHHFESYSYNRFSTDEEIEEFCWQFFDVVWDRFSNEVNNNWISSLEIPISAEVAMHKIATILDLACYKHDGVVNGSEPIEVFNIDLEPSPSGIDNWATGSGKIKILCVTLPFNSA